MSQDIYMHAVAFSKDYAQIHFADAIRDRASKALRK